MPRYDLMHWSQRIRDQQSANSQRAASAPSASARPSVSDELPVKTRAIRPQLPRDDDAEQLLKLCREGRVFELQSWAASGKSLDVPSHYRRTPLRIALETGFHSLIEFLLQNSQSSDAPEEVVRHSYWRNQPGLIRLGMKYGASATAISFQDVIETWDRSIAQLFIEQGADPITNAPFARAFKRRVKAILGIYLDCKRARPDLGDALQDQADMALRQACQDEDLKWVSLLMWLGANPRTKGLTTDDIDSTEALSDDSYKESALQIACRGREPKILRRLKPNLEIDDAQELMLAATSLIAAPETVAYLVGLGAQVNDKSDGGSTALDNCLRYFGWRESVLDAPYPNYSRRPVPLSRLGRSLDALRYVLNAGARWTPDDRTIVDVRRALYRVDNEAIVIVVQLLRTNRVCSESVLTALTRTPKMRQLLRDRERASRRTAMT